MICFYSEFGFQLGNFLNGKNPGKRSLLLKRLTKVLSKTLLGVSKARLKAALIRLTEKHQISPAEIQTKHQIPLLVLSSNKASRAALAFYLARLFEQIIS